MLPSFPELHLSKSGVLAFRLSAAALLYALLATTSLAFFSGHGAVSIFWPPAGLAFAIVLLTGPLGAVSVFLGALLANGLDAHFPLLTALGVAGSNATGALVALGITRGSGRDFRRIRSLPDYFHLLSAGFVGALVCAALGVLVMLLSGEVNSDRVGHSVLHWWMGDTLGIVMLTPMLLVWSEPPGRSPWSAKGVEAVMLLLLAFVVGQIVYFGWFGATAGTVVGHYWMFLIVVWVAVRLGIHGVVLVLCMGAIQGVMGTYQAEGMFASEAVQAPQINFWFFLLLLSTVGVALAVHFARHEKLAADLGKAIHRQNAMLDALPDLMFEIGLDGRFYRIHARDPKLLVAPIGEMLASTIGQVMPPHASDVVMAALGRAHADGNASGYQFELTFEHGRMWFEISVARMRGSPDDDQPHFILLSRDITQRKRAQESLRIAAIAFESEEGIVVLDQARNALRVNEAFCRLTGYGADEVLGRSFGHLRSPRHDQSFYASIWNTVAESGRWQGEVWMRRKDGAEMAIWGTLTAVRDESERVTHYVRTMTDVTHLKDQERERLAREAQLRDALVREVHHRIKNNLQGVNGVLRQFGQNHPEIAVPINQAISQMQSIAAIHGLQGLGVAGELSLPQTLRAVAGGVASTWQAPITVEMDDSTQAFSIGQHDAVPLALVFNELLSNAVKHGGINGSVRLALHRVEPLEDGRTPTVKVVVANRLPEPMLQPASAVPAVVPETTGLQLVAALLPPQGAVLDRAVLDGMYVTTLVLKPPAIILEEGNPT